MAAQSFKVYNEAKRKIGAALIALTSTAFRMALFQSASNAATLTLSIYNELTNEVAEANGYSSSGKALTGEVWTVGASAKSYKFDCDDVVWTGTGGTIPNIKLAAIFLSAAASANRHLLTVASLTSAQFTLSQNNTLTLQVNSLGVFTMA